MLKVQCTLQVFVNFSTVLSEFFNMEFFIAKSLDILGRGKTLAVHRVTFLIKTMTAHLKDPV